MPLSAIANARRRCRTGTAISLSCGREYLKSFRKRSILKWQTSLFVPVVNQPGRGGMSGRKPTFLLLRTHSSMALNLEQIRATAQRVAASHGLNVVEIEYQGGSTPPLL